MPYVPPLHDLRQRLDNFAATVSPPVPAQDQEYDQQAEDAAHPAGEIDEYSKANGYHIKYDDGHQEDLSVRSLMRCCEAVLSEQK